MDYENREVDICLSDELANKLNFLQTHQPKKFEILNTAMMSLFLTEENIEEKFIEFLQAI